MSIPNPIYNASPVYASPTIPTMAPGSPYGLSPYAPGMTAQTAYYPPMGAMQVGPGQPMVIPQQPYGIYRRQRCCCDCCYGDCSCCAGM
ncbi:hypothetical protein BD560DRAFT_435540 [Blakeslea trispora]|nr:hypothetical protein BD560DRAFT_435540 [Blakeslea trispora]